MIPQPIKRSAIKEFQITLNFKIIIQALELLLKQIEHKEQLIL